MELKSVDISGLTVRYLETDGKSDIPLIILHGWGSSADSWTNVARTLEKRGAKVFIPDLPGFGKSPEPPYPWGIAQYADFINSFSQKLEVAKFSLAGHSFGGQIAIAYAAAHAQNLSNLILIAAARIMRRKKLRVRLFLIATKIGNLIFVLPPFVFLRPLVRKIWYRISGERDYYRASTRMRETFKLVEEEVGSHLESISVPTLILWGDQDEATPIADARIIHERIQNSQLYIFSNAGHDLNFKKPVEIAQKIYDFIR